MKCPKSITQPALTFSKLPMEMSEQMWEKYSSFTIKTPKDVTWCYSGVIIGDFEQINTGWDLLDVTGQKEKIGQTLKLTFHNLFQVYSNTIKFNRNH